MSSHNRTSSLSHPHSTSQGASQQPEKSFFESQREMLVTEVAQSLESVLQNLNKLNRALEEVIAVGNEFSPVEALWSHFENVMATRGEEEGGEGGGEGEKGDGEETVHGAEGEDEERSGK